MTVVELRCRSAELGTLMTELRSWLDHRQVHTSFFELVPRRTGAIVIRLQLQDVRHAATLADTFNGKVVGERLAAAA